MMSADGSQDLVRQAIADRLARFAPIEVSAQFGARVLRFSYRTAGSGRPLILLHGIGGSSGAWLHQYESLADTFRGPLKAGKPAAATISVVVKPRCGSGTAPQRASNLASTAGSSTGW